MAFINSASTVTVQAFLTAAGRKKLFDSLEEVNEPFVTKFALGDSDANYGAIDAGFGTLNSGSVPEPGEFKPRVRSFLLQSGMYKPSTAHIVIDGRYGGSEGHYRTFPIGSNVAEQRSYKLETEWPKKSRYEESYSLTFDIAGSNSVAGASSLFAQYFDLTFQNNEVIVTFRGGMDLSTLQNIIGADDETNNGWTFQIRIEGLESQAVTVLDIDFVQ